VGKRACLSVATTPSSVEYTWNLVSLSNGLAGCGETPGKANGFFLHYGGLEIRMERSICWSFLSCAQVPDGMVLLVSKVRPTATRTIPRLVANAKDWTEGRW
jgi:hypothetical protein